MYGSPVLVPSTNHHQQQCNQYWDPFPILWLLSSRFSIVYTFFQHISSVLHLPFSVWSFGSFIKFANQICISHIVQTLLRAIVGKNFFAANIIKNFGGK